MSLLLLYYSIRTYVLSCRRPQTLSARAQKEFIADYFKETIILRHGNAKIKSLFYNTAKKENLNALIASELGATVNLCGRRILISRVTRGERDCGSRVAGDRLGAT